MSIRPIDYKQNDPRWANEIYSNHNDKHQTIRNTGSGPTLAADIVATLANSRITPSVMAKLAVKWGCRTYCYGTSWNFWSQVAEHFGFKKFVESKHWEAFLECINAGGYVVCNMKEGYWACNMSYVLAYAYDDEYVYCHNAKSKRKWRQKIEGFKRESFKYFCFYPEVDSIKSICEVQNV